MKNLAIIPARSGSKGLKDKNIKELAGVPLLAYSIKAAELAGLFEEIMVSTDSEKYANIAKKNGASVPFLRSELYSGDNAGSWDVVYEVLDRYVMLGRKFDSVCLLQPTSPLRNASDIIRGYNFFVEKKCDAITSVCEVDHSPQFTMTLPEDNSLIEFRKKTTNVPRQKLKKYYRLNGAVYIRKIKYENDNVLLLDKSEYAFVMERKNSVDIDTIDDFEYAEWLIKNR